MSNPRIGSLRDAAAAALAFSLLPPPVPVPSGGLPAPKPPGSTLVANGTQYVIAEPNIFQNQATWVVDSVNGNDDNSGIDAAHALKTPENLTLRLQGAVLQQNTTITFLGDFTTKRWSPRISLAATRVLTINFGTLTQVATGTLTGVTAINRPTNQALTLTDAGVADWTPYIGMFLVNTTVGPRFGAIAVIDKNLGANQVRCAGMRLVDPTAGVDSASTPVVGDTYKIVHPSVPLGSIDLEVHRDWEPVTQLAACVITGMKLVDVNAISRLAADPAAWISALECDVASLEIEHNAMIFYQSNFSQLLFAALFISIEPAPYSGILGCRLGNGIDISGGPLIVGEDTLSRNTVTVGSGGILNYGNLGIFDSPAGSGVYVWQGGFIYDSTNHQIYGSGNFRYGIESFPGSDFIYVTKPVVTGALGNTSVAGVVLAYASIPASIAGASIRQTTPASVPFGATTLPMGLLGSAITASDGTWTVPILPTRQTLANTTDATPANFTNITIPDNAHTTVEVRVECYNTGGSGGVLGAIFTYQAQFQVKKLAGVATLVQTNPTLGTVYDEIGVGGITAATNANNLRVTWTGKAGTTISPSIAYWLQQGITI